MPSSTSSSDHGRLDGDSYERPLPALNGGAALGLALALFVLALGAWELYWRDFGVTPGYRNSDERWAEQRRRIDTGEGNRTVIVGSSRLLFDVQLPVWERLAGERPIQLALEGSSPVAFLEDLADDPDFTGRLLVGVTPGLFFSGFAVRIDALKHYRKETPAQRSGHRLSTWLLEPWLAFYDEDFALITVLKRQAWPTRPGVPVREAVRKISMSAADRNTRMWDKVENDPQYQAMAQRIWAQNFKPLPPEAIEKAMKTRDEQIDKAVAAVKQVAGAWCGSGVRTRAERRPAAGIRTQGDAARIDLGRADRQGRRARHPLRGSSGAAGIPGARMVASVGERRGSFHCSALSARRARIRIPI
ncbi:MAG: hypothetical protein IPO66_01155 [Rhodanobacteraceae bacterium]|nr:hypothetical protein [Rhodanobacteraceae bacterium]